MFCLGSPRRLEIETGAPIELENFQVSLTITRRDVAEMSKPSTCFAMSRRGHKKPVEPRSASFRAPDWTSGPGANRSVLWVAERAKTLAALSTTEKNC